MDIFLELPPNQLIFYTDNINDEDIIELAQKRDYKELVELLTTI